MTAQARLRDGRSIAYLPEVLGEGAMKRVYLTADRSSVICFYKDQSLQSDPNRLARLEAILGKSNPTTDSVTGGYFRNLLCWPTGIVVAPEFGVLVPAYSKNFYFAGGTWQGREKEVKWFSSPKLHKLLPANERGHFGDFLQVCLLLARAVRKLHMSGVAHSDLSGKNVLLDPTGGRCAVTDLDSLVVPGVYAPDVLGTPGYIAPEVLTTQHLALDDRNRKLPSNLTDLHALAVLIYECLLRRHPLRGPKVNGPTTEEDELLSMGAKSLFIEDPHDLSNHVTDLAVPVDRLGPYLPVLFRRAFVDGLHNPPARPGADDWESALGKSQDLLLPCGNPKCDDKFFFYNEAEKETRCPWCNWRQSEPVPILDFYYAPSGRKGHFRREGHSLVAHDQRRLHRWHVYRNFRSGEGVDSEPVAHIARDQGRWLLVNRDLDGLISPGGNPVPRGQACELHHGDEVLLGREEHARLVVVKMIP